MGRTSPRVSIANHHNEPQLFTIPRNHRHHFRSWFLSTNSIVRPHRYPRIFFQRAYRESHVGCRDVTRLANGTNKKISRMTLSVLIRPDRTIANERRREKDKSRKIGALPEQAVCYCIGVGPNATFDIALNARGKTVKSFDLTPRSKQYAERAGCDKRMFTFIPGVCGAKPKR